MNAPHEQIVDPRVEGWIATYVEHIRAMRRGNETYTLNGGFVAMSFNRRDHAAMLWSDFTEEQKAEALRLLDEPETAPEIAKPQPELEAAHVFWKWVSIVSMIAFVAHHVFGGAA